MNRKEYTLPNGKKAVFEYDVCGIGKVTLECMDMLMAMIADRPQGEWLEKGVYDNDDGDREMVEQWQSAQCSICKRYFTTPYLYYFDVHKYCPHCGAKMKG